MWKQWKCLSLDESVKRGGDGGGGVCVLILFSRKEEDILPFATTWMDLESIILIEISQIQKDKY